MANGTGKMETPSHGQQTIRPRDQAHPHRGARTHQDTEAPQPTLLRGEWQSIVSPDPHRTSQGVQTLKLQIEMRYKLNGSNWSAFIIHGPERRTPSVVDVVETWGVVKSSTVESALALDGVRDVMERTAFGDRWH